MAYPWTAYKTWVTGEVLTAGDLNSSFTTVITNSDPSTINDYSVNVATMRTTADPYPASSESLATTLAGELERIRYVINQLNGTAQWYIDPSSSMETVVNGVQTFAGAKTFSTAVTITPTTNQLVLGTTRTVTFSAPTPASASRTITFPDLSGDYSVVGTTGTQEITGQKSLTAANTLFGTTSARTVNTIVPRLQIEGTDAGSSSQSIIYAGNDASGGAIRFAKTRGASGASFTVVQSGDNLGTIRWAGADGSDLNTSAATIHAVVDGTPGATDMPGALVFSVTPDAGASPVECGRFSATGAFRAKGTNTNDSAAAGFIGERISSTIAAASRVTITSTQYTDVTSISLTAGDWDVVALTSFEGSVTGTQLGLGIGTASGNSSTGLVFGDNTLSTTTMPTSNSDIGLSIPSYRVSLSGTTTYYLKVFGTYTVGTLKAYGRISARRVR